MNYPIENCVVRCREISPRLGEWLNTIYGFIYDGPRVILIGSVLKCSDRSIVHAALALYAPGLLKHFQDLRCIAQAVISFQRIIQKVTPLIICTRYPGDFYLSLVPFPAHSRSTRCCVQFDRAKRFIRIVPRRCKYASARAPTPANQRTLNPHVDFSLCHR